MNCKVNFIQSFSTKIVSESSSYEESDVINAIEPKMGYKINDPDATNIPLVTFWNNWKKINRPK